MNYLNMKNTFFIGVSQILIAIAVCIFAAVVFITAQQYLPLANKFLDLKGRQDCATSYRLTFSEKASNTVVSRPIDDLYAKCLTEKGI